MEDSTPTGSKASGSGSSKSLDPGRKYVKQDGTIGTISFVTFVD